MRCVPDDLPLLGFGLPVAGGWATPDRMLRVARHAEDRGFASLWTFQRVLSPVPDEGGAAERGPGARPADDPAYRSVHDPLLPLAYVASHTRRIGLGTATLCAPFTAPALMARSVATLDHLTCGRLTVGLGMGWMRQEYAAAGVPFARRGARLEEYLRCLQQLWTTDPVEFAGEFYTVPRAHAGPKPLQRPHPPVLLGGAAAPALRRAGRLAQGWIASSRSDPEEIGRGVALVREGARESGRDPSALRVLARVVVDLHDDDPGPGRQRYQGTAEQVRDDLRALSAHGVTEALVDLNFSPRVGSPDVDGDAAEAEAQRVLDALAPAAAE